MRVQIKWQIHIVKCEYILLFSPILHNSNDVLYISTPHIDSHSYDENKNGTRQIHSNKFYLKAGGDNGNGGTQCDDNGKCARYFQHNFIGANVVNARAMQCIRYTLYVLVFNCVRLWKKISLDKCVCVRVCVIHFVEVVIQMVVVIFTRAQILFAVVFCFFFKSCVAYNNNRIEKEEKKGNQCAIPINKDDFVNVIRLYK